MLLSSSFDVVQPWTEAQIVVLVAVDKMTVYDLVFQ